MQGRDREYPLDRTWSTTCTNGNLDPRRTYGEDLSSDLSRSSARCLRAGAGALPPTLSEGDLTAHRIGRMIYDERRQVLYPFD